MYTEGGGGRPGDTDVKVNIAGLNSTSFSRWAGLTGKVPRITVNNGYCFAGNAALFGAGDVRIVDRFGGTRHDRGWWTRQFSSR